MAVIDRLPTRYRWARSMAGHSHRPSLTAMDGDECDSFMADRAVRGHPEPSIRRHGSLVPIDDDFWWRVAAGEARFTVSRDGVLVANEALDSLSGSGEILAARLGPLQVPGPHVVTISDAAGNQLANGTLTVTR